MSPDCEGAGLAQGCLNPEPCGGAGLAFIAQFAVCRVGMGLAYWRMMVGAVAARPGPVPAWAAAGVALLGALVALNAFWLAK